MIKIYSTALAVLAALFLDLLVSSNAAMPFRIIYFVAFVALAFAVIYISIHLLRNKEFGKDYTILICGRTFFCSAVLINLIVVFPILWLEVPSIGLFSTNILNQGMNGLPYLLEYAAVMIADGIVLHIILTKKSRIDAYKIAAYVLCAIAIETFLAIYCFHIGSIDGVRLGLASFHIAICGVIIWLYFKLSMKEVQIRITSSDVLLFLVSIGTFLMVYMPHAIYSLFGDTSVIVGSASSILYRGSLQPFYAADAYYSPIGGFVSTVFAYICGLNNIMLASSIPFLIAHLTLPFITYNFLKRFVTEDSRMAIIGSIVALFMDGLAVVLLPKYIGNLARPVIEWQISPATKSLYFSSIAWIWLAPFKTMGIASATALGSILARGRATSFLLGGVLFAFSFVNPRQPFLAILILVFLLGSKKISLKGVAMVFSSALLFLGPIIIATVFKNLQLILFVFHQTGLVAGEISTITLGYYRILSENGLLVTISVMVVCFTAVAFLVRSESQNTLNTKRFVAEYSTRRNLSLRILRFRNGLDIHLSFEDMLFWGLFIPMITYIILHAYPIPFLAIMPRNILIDSFDYMIMRYHILAILAILGFIGFKYSSRVFLTMTTLALVTYLWIILTSVGKGIISPLIFVALAMPSFVFFVKSKKRLILSVVLLLIFLGVFSATFYSATVTTIESEARYADFSDLLPILLKMDPGESVFSASTYSYYSSRILRMAHLQLSSDFSCQLHIIDKAYTNSVTTERVLEDDTNEILYEGNVFIFYRSNQTISQVAPNVGFELGTDVPSNWNYRETDANHEARWDNTIAWSGNRSLGLLVEKGSGANWVRWESDRIFVSRNASVLYLEYYVKQEFSSGSSLVQLNFYNETEQLVMYDRIWQTWNSDWILRTSIVNFPREFSYMTIFLVNRGEGRVWFDNVELAIK